MIQELPNAQRMEQSLLGALLVFPSVYSACQDADLSASEFFVTAHQILYKNIQDIAQKGQVIDMQNVLLRLQENDELEAVGGLDYLSALMDVSVSAAPVPSYISTIQNKAQLRRLILVADEIGHEAATSNDQMDVILDDSERKLLDVTRRRRGSDFKSVQSVIQEVRQEIEILRNSRGVSGIPTSYSELDAMTNGFHRGDLIILAARPAMGKSALALNFANNIAKRNQGPVAIFSLEMPASSLIKRLLSAEGRIDGKKLVSGKLSPTELAAFDRTIDQFHERKIFIDDTSMIKVGQIFSKCRKLKSQEGSIDLIVIDYLQLISGNGRSDSRQQEVSEISRNLKILAKEMDCPVIALSQLSRKVEERTNHEPQLSDLRESGSIEQDADIVMFLYREAYYKPDEEQSSTESVELSLKKHRNGEIGTIQLTFEKSCSLFTSGINQALSSVMENSVYAG